MRKLTKYVMVQLAAIFFSFPANACDSTTVQIDTIFQVGCKFQIDLTLCIGTGVNGGAGNTDTLAFGFVSGCTNELDIEVLTDSVTGQSTGALFTDTLVPPALANLFLPPQYWGALQGAVLYTPANPSNPLLTCIDSVGCGNGPQECYQFSFLLDYVPYQILIGGPEGKYHPLTDCPHLIRILTDSLNHCPPDTVPPIAICRDITLQVDSNGNAQVFPTDLDSASSDNCDIDTLFYASGTGLFDCDDIGMNNLILIVGDEAGNLDSCISLVNTNDQIPPTLICKDITLFLDSSGTALITPPLVIDTINDNCGVASVSFYNTLGQYTCDSIGVHLVLVGGADVNGNFSTCYSMVNVVSPPVASCQNSTVTLPLSGSAQINPSTLDQGSFSICSPLSFSLSDSTFTCLDTGLNIVQLFVSDTLGQKDTCLSTVHILAPQAAVDFVPLILSENGTVSVDFLPSLDHVQSFSWDFGDGVNSSDTMPVHYYLSDSIYSATLIGSNVCTSDTMTRLVNSASPDIERCCLTCFQEVCCTTIVNNPTLVDSLELQFGFNGGNQGLDSIKKCTKHTPNAVDTLIDCYRFPDSILDTDSTIFKRRITSTIGGGTCMRVKTGGVDVLKYQNHQLFDVVVHFSCTYVSIGSNYEYTFCVDSVQVFHSSRDNVPPVEFPRLASGTAGCDSIDLSSMCINLFGGSLDTTFCNDTCITYETASLLPDTLNYSVSFTILDANGDSIGVCRNDSLPYAHNCSSLTSLETESPPQKFEIFPNPSEGSFYANIQGLPNYLPLKGKIFDGSGKLIWQQMLYPSARGFFEIKCDGLPPGIYWLMLEAPGYFLTEKVTILK